MKLISNWKDWWKLYSTYFMILLAVLPAAWEAFPADLKTALPDYTLSIIAVVVGLAGIVSRVILQTNALTEKPVPK